MIDNFVWIFPYVILTNDPTPPSEVIRGVHIKPFAVIATGAVLMPGVIVESDSLVAAGTIVTKNVEKYEVIAGNPGKVISDVRNIKIKLQMSLYILGETILNERCHGKKVILIHGICH